MKTIKVIVTKTVNLCPYGNSEQPAWNVKFNYDSETTDLCVPFDCFTEEQTEYMEIEEARFLWDLLTSNEKTYLV